MKVSEIYSENFKDSCLAFIRRFKLHRQILKHGYSTKEFIDSIISDAFIVIKKDNQWSIGAITGKLITWSLYKLNKNYPDNLPIDLDSFESKNRSLLDIEDFPLSWQEQMILSKLSSGKTLKEISENTGESLYIISKIRDSAYSKIKRSEKC